jgi:ABC-type bacteriocin/lantibiotic exporter with double-glycine peptidase domain
MLLDLPPTLQQSTHDCGPAAVRCLLAFHRVVAPIPVACPLDGCDPRAIEAHLRERCGLSVVAGQLTVADLRHLCDDGRPPILLVTWAGDADSHYVICRGVSRGRIYVHDVFDGRKAVPEGEFLAAWHATDGRLSKPLRRWGIAAWPG